MRDDLQLWHIYIIKRRAEINSEAVKPNGDEIEEQLNMLTRFIIYPQVYVEQYARSDSRTWYSFDISK